MRRNALKTGMRVQRRDGGIRIVMKHTEDGLLFANGRRWIQGVRYGSDWRHYKNPRADIVAIYDKPRDNDYLMNPDYVGDLLWETEVETIFDYRGINWTADMLRNFIDRYNV